MLYAMIDQKRSLASPKAIAICPTCGGEMIAKCGKIVTWHWAHRGNGDCDVWAEGETEWHRQWKAKFKNAEITIKHGDEWHRADVQTGAGWVIEFQHSYLSVGDVLERERFYRQMIWVFDARESRKPIKCEIGGEIFEDFRLTLYRDKKNVDDKRYVTFRWKHARKTIIAATCSTYLDLGDGWLLHIGRVYYTGRCGGWGHLVSYDEFMRLDN